jgi:hypothetical protein
MSRFPFLKSFKFLWKIFDIDRKEKVYVSKFTRTLTLEEMSALWDIYCRNHYLRHASYDRLPESLKEMFEEVDVGH